MQINGFKIKTYLNETILGDLLVRVQLCGVRLFSVGSGVLHGVPAISGIFPTYGTNVPTQGGCHLGSQ